MMRFVTFIIILSGLLTCSSTFGQTEISQMKQIKLDRANRLFDQFAFQSAAETYEEILEHNEDDFEGSFDVKLKLAECYRLTNNYRDAEKWYAEVIRTPKIDPIYKLYFGQVLQSNGKCKAAIKWFKEYAELVPSDTRGSALAASCEEVTSFDDLSELYEIEALPINTPFQDFGPTFMQDGIVFASARRDHRFLDRIDGWQGEPFLELFFSPRSSSDGSFQEPEPFSKDLNTRYHDGPAAFDEKQGVLYFTRNNIVHGRVGKAEDGTVKLKILKSTSSEEGVWEEAIELPFNNNEYSVAHPTLSADGQWLYFSSDMPGGYGGADLYVTKQNGEGGWATPVNLGESINTEGDEVFPFLHPDGTLFFSSDGHKGLGGLDLYSSRYKGTEWTAIANLGYPINSISDDFGLIWDEPMERGYFSSNRSGGQGSDDIYTVTRMGNLIIGRVYDLATGEDLPFSKVKALIANQKRSYKADREGMFDFNVSKKTLVKLNVTKDGYEPGALEVIVENHVERVEIGLVKLPEEPEPVVEEEPVEEEPVAEVEPEEPAQPEYEDLSHKIDTIGPVMIKAEDNPFGVDIKRGVAVELSNIYYDFNEFYIREDATDDLGKLIRLLKAYPGLQVELSSHTDARGSDAYNRLLSQCRADAAVNYITLGGVNPHRIMAKGYGETLLRNNCSNGVNCSDDEHQFNRRTEFKVTDYKRVIKSTDKSQIPTNTWQKANE